MSEPTDGDLTIAEIIDPYEPRPGLTHREADWRGLRVLVAGVLGVSGFPAADILWERGSHVIGVDEATSPTAKERATILEILGVDVRIGHEHTTTLPSEPIDLVVTSPGWSPNQPLLAAARAAGIPIWGEVELAWRMRPAHGAAPWITVTGTNGKTTTVNMTAAILRAAGLRAISCGNVGTPIIECLNHPDPYEVLVVELSSFQLYWSRSLRPYASCCLNVAADHIDWHGSFEEYLRAKGRVYENTEIACVYNVDDPLTEQLVMDADVIDGCRAIGFTFGVPALSMVGVVEDILADRAFVEQRQHSAAELASLDDLRHGSTHLAPHYVANALAAAALARSVGVGPLSVREGLHSFRPDPHRIAEVAQVHGIHFVDDSKATNPHAAQAALHSFESVVWVAGGLLKGSDVDDLVEQAAPRLRGAVLFGEDRALIAASLARHAPDVPIVDLGDADTRDMTAPEAIADVMDDVVRASAGLAVEGDVVLLAPAAASLDMFANYAVRGTAFADAVHRYAEGSSRQ